jgi:hypothetical protein
MGLGFAPELSTQNIYGGKPCFAEKDFGTGDLVCKHFIPILSVIGVLPVWISTMSFLKSTLGNYQYLVKQNKICNTQNDANMFLRTVAYAINCPIIPVAASKVPKSASKPSAT